MDKKNTASIILRSIQKSITSLSDGFHFRTGTGDTPFWYLDWKKLGKLSHLVPYVNISDSTALCLKDVSSNGSWNLRDLYTILPQDIHDVIQSIPLPATLDHRLPNTWIWGHGKNGNYTCASGYHWLLKQHRI